VLIGLFLLALVAVWFYEIGRLVIEIGRSTMSLF
jgi:hypothetical protein